MHQGSNAMNAYQECCLSREYEWKWFVYCCILYGPEYSLCIVQTPVPAGHTFAQSGSFSVFWVSWGWSKQTLRVYGCCCYSFYFSFYSVLSVYTILQKFNCCSAENAFELARRLFSIQKELHFCTDVRWSLEVFGDYMYFDILSVQRYIYVERMKSDLKFPSC